MKNCLSCKISDECDFGKAVNTLNEYKESEDGFNIVVKLLTENIKQYIKCNYYES
jgi:hypothetical protein